MAESVGLLQILRGQEERHAVPVQLLHVSPHRVAGDWIETGRGFVQEHDARLVDQRTRQVQPALHPARVALHRPVGVFAQGHDFEQVVRPTVCVCVRNSKQPGLQHELFPPRLKVIEADLLECDANRLTDLVRVLEDVQSANLRRPGSRPKQRREHPHGCGLAGTVLTQEAEDLALRYVQVDSINGPNRRGKMFDQVPGHYCLHSRSIRAR